MKKPIATATISMDDDIIEEDKEVKNMKRMINALNQLLQKN